MLWTLLLGVETDAGPKAALFLISVMAVLALWSRLRV